MVGRFSLPVAQTLPLAEIGGGAPRQRGGLPAVFVLEREAKLGSVGEAPVLPQVDVLCDDLGDPEIAERLAGSLDRD
jgi:hypothetical protein